MKKIFLIFTVLVACISPQIGDANPTSMRTSFESMKNDMSQQMDRTRQEQQEKMAQMEKEAKAQMEKLRQEAEAKRQSYNAKLDELRQKNPEAFANIGRSFDEYIQNTPFENCEPGYSSIRCTTVNNKTYSAWACTLKSNVTKEKMNADVQKHCSTNRRALTFEPKIPDTTPTVATAQVRELTKEEEVNAYAEYPADENSDFMAAKQQDKRDWENPEYDTPEPADVAATPSVDKSASALLAQSAKQSEKQKENTQKAKQDSMLAAAFKKYCDDEGYTLAPGAHGADLPGAVYGTYTAQCGGSSSNITLTCYKKKKNVSFSPADLGHYCSPETTNQFKLVESSAGRPSFHIRNCRATDKKSINATDCKISVGGQYSDVKCDNDKGYWLNATSTACEKQGRQETNKKCTPEQLKQLNAKSGKLYYYAETPNTQYCGITTCNDNYVIDNSQQQEKCVCPKTDEFIETGGKCVRKTNLINIIGKVIDSDTKQPIKWVTVTYDEGKKNKEGKIKYGILKTGGNGMFNIDVIAGTTVKFEHNDYLVGEIQNAAPDTTAEVKLTPKSSEYLLFQGIVMDQETITPIPKAKIKYNKETITADENGKFDIRAPKDTVITFQAPGYNDREWKLEYETFEITEVPMTKTDKAAKNADLQKLCEKDGKSKWNKTLKSCNCNDKGAFFDETDGCTTATAEYNTSKEQLDTLYKQFQAQLASIKNATPQTADEQ